MKRASYRDAVDWCAQNDSAGDDDPPVSVCLVADLFDVPQAKVAADVIKRRIKLKITKYTLADIII